MALKTKEMAEEINKLCDTNTVVKALLHLGDQLFVSEDWWLRSRHFIVNHGETSALWRLCELDPPSNHKPAADGVDWNWVAA